MDVASLNRQVIDEYRANQGQLSGDFAGAPLLLLTTTGAKSGRSHTIPLMYSEDGDRLLIVASKAGAPEHPHWYRNVVANPRVRVEIGDRDVSAAAEVIVGEERDQLYASIAERMPDFAEYQKKTSRTIPVVALTLDA